MTFIIKSPHTFIKRLSVCRSPIANPNDVHLANGSPRDRRLYFLKDRGKDFFFSSVIFVSVSSSNILQRIAIEMNWFLYIALIQTSTKQS